VVLCTYRAAGIFEREIKGSTRLWKLILATSGKTAVGSRPVLAIVSLALEETLCLNG
jgi:hypothetical protein